MTENGVPDARITGKLFDIYRPEAGFSTGCSPVSAQVFRDLSSLVKTVLCVIGLFLFGFLQRSFKIFDIVRFVAQSLIDLCTLIVCLVQVVFMLNALSQVRNGTLIIP